MRPSASLRLPLLLLLACKGGDAEPDSVPNTSCDTSEPMPCLKYLDYDQDGYGDPAVFVDHCGELALYVENSVDCDDRIAEVNVGEVETCDDLDNDCDGLIDEDGANPRSWYPDADWDGQGDQNAEATVSCDSPGPGWVEGPATDCNDDANQVYASSDPDFPFYSEPDPSESFDYNCDGVEEPEYPIVADPNACLEEGLKTAVACGDVGELVVCIDNSATYHRVYLKCR